MSSAFEVTLLAMFGLGICDCLLVVGGMVELAVFAIVHRLAADLSSLTSLTGDDCVFLT